MHLLLENGFTPLSGEFSKTAWYSCFPVLLKASLASATLAITVGPFMCHEHCPFSLYQLTYFISALDTIYVICLQK